MREMAGAIDSRPVPANAPGVEVEEERDACELVARTFAVDVLTCPKCHGRMRLLAVIKEPANVARYLAAVGADVVLSPAAAAIEDVVGRWLLELLSPSPAAARTPAEFPACPGPAPHRR